MSGCKITCYADSDECRHMLDGWCHLYDRPCVDIHVNVLKEDGEE